MGKHQIRSKIKRFNKEKHRAIFLDRDGVINRALVHDGKPYPPCNLSEFEILPGVAEACAILEQAGYVLIVVTNQPDVSRGTLSKNTVKTIHSLLCERLPIDRVDVCYHSGRGLSDCDCRKPRPGMLMKAASELDIDLEQSWMVGDRGSDIECGHSAGCRTILIGDGYKEIFRTLPNFQAQSLHEAVTIILN